MNNPQVRGGLEVVEESIPARIEQIAATHPTRIALDSGTWRAAYAELNAAANRLAHALIASGGKAGDRVAIVREQVATSETHGVIPYEESRKALKDLGMRPRASKSSSTSRGIAPPSASATSGS